VSDSLIDRVALASFTLPSCFLLVTLGCGGKGLASLEALVVLRPLSLLCLRMVTLQVRQFKAPRYVTSKFLCGEGGGGSLVSMGASVIPLLP
jgi:hypothetical protein